MTFNSFLFLLVFLPVVLIVYWILRGQGRYSLSVKFLTLASVIFYGINYPKGLPILLASLILNYLWAVCILKSGRKALLVAGVTFDVLLLAIFKYGSLLIPFIGTTITAPCISFYSFCEIALLFECYRGTVNSISVTEYSFLMTFFPKMLEGPIVRPNDLLPQTSQLIAMDADGSKIKAFDWDRAWRMLLLFSMGLFKKVILAEVLGKAVDYGFTNLNVLHSGEALVVMLSYTLQLYFDFSGYSDMAIAIAALLGFDIPINFNSPYKAKNICDFWDRWHISLTTFFTRYLYIPLGGNRKGKTRMYINFLIVFFISGLWHGSGLQFIIWGMMHGVLFLITRVIVDSKIKVRIPQFVKCLITFLYVNVAWVFFRAPSVDDAVHLFSDMAQCWFPRFNIGLAKCFNMDELWYVLKILHLTSYEYSLYILMVAILVFALVVVFVFPTAIKYVNTCRVNFANTALMTILMVWSILSFEGVATYIYVNF